VTEKGGLTENSVIVHAASMSCRTCLFAAINFFKVRALLPKDVHRFQEEVLLDHVENFKRPE
jgi:hypothetical protein